MKNKKITQEIFNALHQWLSESKMTHAEIASLAGVKRTAVTAWLNNDSESMRGNVFVAIFPYLKKYLPASFNENENEKKTFIIEEQKKYDLLTTDMLHEWNKLSRKGKIKILEKIEEIKSSKRDNSILQNA